MKIAIEAQRIFRSNKHGMDYVALETIRQIQRIDKENEYYIFVAPGDDRCLESSGNMHVVELKCPSYPLWEQIALPRAVKKYGVDMLHCTSNTAPLYCPVPLVLTLHDIIFLEKKRGSNPSLYQSMGWYYRRLMVPRILKKCHTIITVSDYERVRIRKFLKWKKDNLIAIHNGYSPYFRPVENPLPVTSAYFPCEKYWFFLGNTDPKKNSLRTLKAYALYARLSPQPLPLVVADLDRVTVEAMLRAENAMDVVSNVHCPGYIRNTDLPAVYSGAFAFIYTSLRESFGIPLLEAMACGTPVISSNTSAIPEVAGSGAMLVDPTSEEIIARQMLNLEKDGGMYQAQVDYGLERVKQFSWEKTARALLDLYKTVE